MADIQELRADEFSEEGLQPFVHEYLDELTQLAPHNQLRPGDFIVDHPGGGSSGQDTELTQAVVEEQGPKVLDALHSSGIHRGILQQRMGQIGKNDRRFNQAAQSRDPDDKPKLRERIDTRVEHRLLRYADQNR